MKINICALSSKSRLGRCKIWCKNLALTIGDFVSLMTQRFILMSFQSQFGSWRNHWGPQAPWQWPPSVPAQKGCFSSNFWRRL